jgi:dolichol-phosphate hexosyltransferase
MYKGRQISVVIPCLRNAPDLKSVLSRVPSYIDETIVVLDLEPGDCAAERMGVEGVRFIGEDVRGSGTAYRTALMQAKGDIIVSLDGDHLFPVDSVSYLLEILLHSNVRFVSGSRFPLGNRNAMSFKYWLGNRALSLVFSLLYFRWVSDSQSGVWIFERSVLNEVNLIGDMLALSEELKIEAIRNPNIGFLEVYLDFSNRSVEIRLRPFRDGFHNLLFMIRKRFTRRRPRQ